MGRVGMWVVWGLVGTGAGCTPRDEVVKVGHRGVTFADIALAQQTSRLAAARLLGGDDFGAVAREMSQDVGTAERGGDLGQVRAGQLPQELFDAAEALKVGEVSRPTHSSFGIHIFKALSPIEHVQPSFDEVKGQLAVKLRHDAQARLNERLRGEIRVVRHTEKLDAGEPK